MAPRTLALVLIVLAFVAAACEDDSYSTLTSNNAPSDVIVFGARTADGDGLYIARPDGVLPDGSGLQLLQSERDLVSSPVWSPDGGRSAYLVGAGDLASLRVYDFDTGTATTVSLFAVTNQAGRSASWSPDGRRLAFTEAAGEDLRIGVYDVGRAEAVSFPHVIGAEPDWSPDGEELAFVRAGEGSKLYVMGADGDAPEELRIEPPGRLQAPLWSPDGTQLVVTGGEAGDEALLLVERDSGAVTRLGPGQHPSWSPASLPASSPDSAQLAFSARSTDRETDLDIYVIAAEGGAQQPISQAVTRDLWPTWSSDGARVAFLSQVDRQTAFICFVRFQPEERDCLNLPDVLPTTPAWSPR